MWVCRNKRVPDLDDLLRQVELDELSDSAANADGAAEWQSGEGEGGESEGEGEEKEGEGEGEGDMEDSLLDELLQERQDEEQEVFE